VSAVRLIKTVRGIFMSQVASLAFPPTPYPPLLLLVVTSPQAVNKGCFVSFGNCVSACSTSENASCMWSVMVMRLRCEEIHTCKGQASGYLAWHIHAHITSAAINDWNSERHIHGLRHRTSPSPLCVVTLPTVCSNFPPVVNKGLCFFWTCLYVCLPPLAVQNRGRPMALCFGTYCVSSDNLLQQWVIAINCWNSKWLVHGLRYPTLPYRVPLIVYVPLLPLVVTFTSNE